MDVISREWAGKRRPFRLSFGGVMDLEQACGGVAFGVLFQRVSVGQFFAADIRNTLRLGLIGGGMAVDQADDLVARHFDATPYMVSAVVVQDVMSAVMTGIEPGKGDGEGDLEPIKFSDASQICRVFSLSPQDLRDLRFADFVNLMVGYNAALPQKLEPITEEEFDDILARYEPDALKPAAPKPGKK